ENPPAVLTCRQVFGEASPYRSSRPADQEAVDFPAIRLTLVLISNGETGAARGDRGRRHKPGGLSASAVY
ncbi:MAG: hypothetical protein SVR81_10700, partial [Chloroflexota bacterium]|nr:hypothetical protein [Chloroflexota bacterium]